MSWKPQPLTGWRKAVVILWTAVLGAGLGVWAETCRFATHSVNLEYVTDEPFYANVYVNPLYLGYGVVMGLLWGEIFCKVQKSVWAWGVASLATIAVCAFLPYRIEAELYEQATAIGFFAPLTFAAVHGLWLFPWRQRPWTEFIEDEDQDSHV